MKSIIVFLLLFLTFSCKKRGTIKNASFSYSKLDQEKKKTVIVPKKKTKILSEFDKIKVRAKKLDSINKINSGIILEYLDSSISTDQIDKFISFITRDKKAGNKYDYVFRDIPCISPIKPEDKQKISSKFSKKRYHPIEKINKPHLGIDICTKKGITVYATADGVIENIKYSNYGYGNRVFIKHGFGFKTRYAHLSIILVKNIGDKVKQGQIIGLVGNTGKSTGDHLHYEIHKNGNSLNPIDYFNMGRNYYQNKLE